MKITQLKNNKNGSLDMFYQLTQEEINCFKRAAKLKKKRYSIKFVNSCMLKAIKQGLKRDMNLAKKTPTATNKTIV